MTIAPDSELMQIFDFTEADLEANRAGQLSERQIKKLSELKQQGQWLARGGCIIVIVFVLLTFGSGLLTSMKDGFTSIIVIVGVVVLPIIFMSLGAMDRDADLRRNKPKIYVGKLRLSLQHGKFGPIYRIFTSEVDIKIPALAYNLFDHYLYIKGKETVFRLYYAPNSNELLSIEVVE